MKEILLIDKIRSITIREARLDECGELQKICESWDDKKDIEGEVFEQDYIYNCLTKGDLPPVTNARIENYKLLSIYLDTNKLVGFTDLYYGYPNINKVWISIFIINKEFRNNKIAQNVIKMLTEECKQQGYEKIGIGVHLKNWRALRFWTKIGFDKIIGIKGDKEYSHNSYSLIELEKEL